MTTPFHAVPFAAASTIHCLLSFDVFDRNILAVTWSTAGLTSLTTCILVVVNPPLGATQDAASVVEAAI